jgi:hypothetical protein
MGNFLRAIAEDLRRGANVDLYATIAVCLVVGVMSAFGVAKVEWVLAAILAALLIQAANFISEQRKLDAVVTSVTVASNPKLVGMNDTDFAVYIRRALKISMACVANFRFLASNAVDFADFVRRGGALRLVMLDPTSKQSVEMAAARSIGSSTSPEYTMAQIQLTIGKFKELASHKVSGGQVQLKLTPYVTSVVMSWFEFAAEPGLIFVTVTGFRQPTGTRLTIVVREDAEPLAYKFFATFFDNVWTWDHTQIYEV